MVKKKDFVARLIAQVEPRHPVPSAPKSGISLLEQGMILVLMRFMTQRQAEASLTSLKDAYLDWNEARVSQVQELASHFKTGARTKGVTLLRELAPAARQLKAYLQDVFQQTHGLDLEFFREDPPAAGKVIGQLSVLDLTGGGYLMWVAQEGRVPVHITLMRMLARLGLLSRTSSIKKAADEIALLVPEGKELEFTVTMHEVTGRWSDAETPIYLECEILRELPYGNKAHQDRVAQLKRLAAQRKREHERQIVAERKEAEQQRRDDERATKRAAAEAKRRTRELDKRRRADERKRTEEARKVEAEKARVEALKRKAEAKKKAEAARKMALKKAAAHKVAAQKAAAKKVAAKKVAAKKVAAKKAAAKKKKAGAKKVPARKAGASKTGRQVATKKKSNSGKKKPAGKPAGKAGERGSAKARAAGAKKTGASRQPTKKVIKPAAGRTARGKAGAAAGRKKPAGTIQRKKSRSR